MCLNTIKFRRCVCPPKTAAFDLHDFCDASKMAYAVVVYIRVRGPTGIFCKLLTSKTKVAPVNALSMPRLETYTATVGANLTNFLVQLYKNLCRSKRLPQLLGPTLQSFLNGFSSFTVLGLRLLQTELQQYGKKFHASGSTFQANTILLTWLHVDY